MALITGKTIYVLGAGASQHTGAPLLKDFLVAAKLLREGRDQLHYQASFDRVFNWIDRLRGSSYYVEIDLDNIEHVFSLAEMSKQLGLDEGKDLFSDLRYVIMETLDRRCQLEWSNKRLHPDALYSKFVNALREMNDERISRTGRTNEPAQRDAIVTFNYDVMLEYAMLFHSIKPEYCLGSEPYQGYFQVFKLHGSTNWASCECRKDGPQGYPQIVPPSPIPPGHSLLGFESGLSIEFRMVTQVLSKTKCNYCGKDNVLKPIVIPPRWSKIVERTPLAKVWETAVNMMKNAYQIVIIGYSMPTTDTFFQYLLSLGLASNPRLHRVVVVNTDGSDQLRERYTRIFSRSLSDRVIFPRKSGHNEELVGVWKPAQNGEVSHGGGKGQEEAI